MASSVLAADYKGPDLKGEVVTITCPWTGAEEGVFKKVITVFEKSTGATVKHSCSQSSEQQIVIDIKAGSPPTSLCSHSQVWPPTWPPLVAWCRWATKHAILSKQTSPPAAHGPTSALTNKAGKKEFFGLFYNVNVKSLVWYIPENFKEKGYKVPKSMEELQDLDQENRCRRWPSPGVSAWVATQPPAGQQLTGSKT